jgi:lysophospholipase L1-like esterase
MIETKAFVFATLLAAAVALHAADNPKQLVKSGDRICFIGDSITAMGTSKPHGYVQLAVAGLKANGIAVEWQSNCGGGQTSQGVIDRFMPATLKYKPDFVTIVIGTNDVGHQKVAADGSVTEGTNGVFLPRYKTNYRAFTDAFTAAGIQTLILTPPPHGEPTDSARDVRLLPYIAFLNAFAKEKGYPCVDLHKMIRKEIEQRSKATGEPPRYIVTCDGCHMNPIGDTIMAKAILQAYGLNADQVRTAEAHWYTILNPDVIVDSQNIPLDAATKFESLPAEMQEAIKQRFAKLMASEIANAASKGAAK